MTNYLTKRPRGKESTEVRKLFNQKFILNPVESNILANAKNQHLIYKSFSLVDDKEVRYAFENLKKKKLSE